MEHNDREMAVEDGIWLYPPKRFEDDEGGAVAVIEFCHEAGRWRMTGIVATCDYGDARLDFDGVDQLVVDIRARRVHRRRRWLESSDAISRVATEIYGSPEEADVAASRWLDEQARRP